MKEAAPLLWNAKEAGKQLGLSPATLKEMAREGRVPAFMLGNKWVFPVSKLEDFISEQVERQQPRSERLADVNKWLTSKGKEA